MVHAAMHDAIQAYDGRYEPYAIAVANATGSPVAAAASAAHDVLVALFGPSKKADLDTLLFNYLNSRVSSETQASAFGSVAAAALLSLRVGDGRFPIGFPAFSGGTKPGEWRPTLSRFRNDGSAVVRSCRPLHVKRPDATPRVTPPPPKLNSGEYTNDYNEVKALGSASFHCQDTGPNGSRRFLQ
jgi:hypothetical protein